MPCRDSFANRNPFSIFDPGKFTLTAPIKKRLLPQADYSDHLIEVGIPLKKWENSSWGKKGVAKMQIQGQYNAWLLHRHAIQLMELHSSLSQRGF